LQIVKELQRRNVFRVTLGYVVSSWLLIQVADVALESFGSPDWVMRTIILLLALGFPIVVFFSWAYEVTPEGIKRESEIDRSQSITHVTGRKLDRAIIAVLALALSYFAYDKYLVPEAPQDAGEGVVAQVEEELAAENGKSIAVLPFVNMSGDESSAYFSDGLADTVLHMLAQVADLRVAARTSSFQFRDQALGIAEIGRQLNVSSVLEGSVQKSGDKIRVTAQLIDVSNGFHLWSGNFDRDLNDVFVIQDEIAAEVVTALKLSLLGEAAATLASDRTDDLDAYTEYLLGTEKLGSVNTNNLNAAVQHLQQAVRIDPEYARAYSTLGRAYLEMSDYGSMRREQAMAAAREAASRALDLDPTSSEALAVLGRVALMDNDLDLAGDLLGKAVELSPNDTAALFAYTRYLRNWKIDRREEALAIGREWIRRDPLSEEANRTLSNSLNSLDRYDEALELWTNYLLVRPDSQIAHENVSGINKLMGNFAMAIAYNIEQFERYPDNADPEFPFDIGEGLLELDMPDEAAVWFNRAIELDPQHPVSRAAPLLLDWYRQEYDDDSFRLARKLLDARIDDRFGARGIALDVLFKYGFDTGRHAVVLDTLDNLYPHLFDDPPHDIDKDADGAWFTAFAFMRVGETERGVDLLNSMDELYAPLRSVYGTNLGHVAISIELGDKQEAAARLAEFVQSERTSPIINKIWLERESIFDPIRDDPVFIEYLHDSQRLAAEQRQLLQAMLENSAEHE